MVGTDRYSGAISYSFQGIDEKLPLYVVLRTKYLEESLLKSYISRIGIVLEAHAISSAQVASADGKNEARASEARDVIWTGRVDVSKEPIMAVEDSEDEGGQRHVLLIWKLLAFLSKLLLAFWLVC